MYTMCVKGKIRLNGGIVHTKVPKADGMVSANQALHQKWR